MSNTFDQQKPMPRRKPNNYADIFDMKLAVMDGMDHAMRFLTDLKEKTTTTGDELSDAVRLIASERAEIIAAYHCGFFGRIQEELERVNAAASGAKA